MLTRADNLASMTVLDENGAAVTVGTLWRERTAVLVFVRHFGCIYCRDHVTDLHRDGDQFRAANADLHVIGNGSPSFIEGFREQTEFTGSIYTDPSLDVYKAAELKRGVFATFHPRGFGKAIRAFAGGGRQSLTVQGDQWQQGGVLVIAPSGEIVWHYVSGRGGDDPSVRQIVSEMRASSRPSSRSSSSPSS